MSRKKIKRSVNRIAEEVLDQRGSEAVIKLLNDVADWKNEIKVGRNRRYKREAKRVASANTRARKENLPATLTNAEWIETLEYF